MRGSTLVSGGSDGSVRVWSLSTYTPIHRLAAHDNSVTSLQFDDARIVSGGSDGRVKIWDLKTGQLIRELSQPAEAVWRVAFEEERSVVLASRGGKTVMEVWDFAPPGEQDEMSVDSGVDEVMYGVESGHDSETASLKQEDEEGNVDMVDAYGTDTNDGESNADMMPDPIPEQYRSVQKGGSRRT